MIQIRGPVSNSQRSPAKGDVEHESGSRRLNMREKLASKLRNRDREASLRGCVAGDVTCLVMPNNAG
jgi:hypothetical protein